jgi:hypothetical protein
MPRRKSSNTGRRPDGLSAAEHAHLDTWIVAIAGEARGKPILTASGDWRFGSTSGALCVYANGQYHDFSGGAHEHGWNALHLIEHLHPDADPLAWARNWLALHPDNGSFAAAKDLAEDSQWDYAELEATAFIKALHNGAAPIAGTPGLLYLTTARGLPLSPEDMAPLRWVDGYRGDEGALLAPVTDQNGELVKLMVIHVTREGVKSPHSPSRMTINGARRPGLCRLGMPGPTAVETEGLEKGLAARAAGAEYVVVTGGTTIGKVSLPTAVKTVIVARDADPAGSPADVALWRGVVRRLGQGLTVVVTVQPNIIAPADAPFLKDLDDLWRHDPALVARLLKDANLKHATHGRLGPVADEALLSTASWLDAIALGRARKGVAELLGTSLDAFDKEMAKRFRERSEAHADAAQAHPGGPEPWDQPVTDMGAVADEAARIIKRYVSAPDTHIDTVVVWSAFAHALHKEDLCIDISPRLAIQSPEKDSGKSTLMKLVRILVPRPKGGGLANRVVTVPCGRRPQGHHAGRRG